MAKRSKNPYQKADHFTRRAKDQGYAARSVFKLQEIQRRFPILKRGMFAVDLGCCPGSWWDFASQVVGPTGKVLGLDIERPNTLHGPFIEASIVDTSAAEICSRLGGAPHVVLSDIAPHTTGDTFGDHVRQMELARAAADFAIGALRPGGAFVCKVFDGEEAHAFVMDLRAHFKKVKRVRPEAVRRQSREFFVVALERQGPGKV